MKKILLVSVIIFGLLLSFPAFSDVPLPLGISDCQLNCSNASCINNNNTAGIYICLNQSFTDSNTTSINITADNITIDCRRYTITGNASDNNGILTNNTINLTVKNCIFTNYTRPIYFNENCTNCSIINNTFNQNVGGPKIVDSYDVSFINNTVNNGTNGVWCGGCYRAYVYNNTFNYIGNRGIYFNDGGNNTATYNTINEAYTGTWINTENYDNITYNTFYCPSSSSICGSDLIDIDQNGNHRIINNTITNSPTDGIDIHTSSNLVIENNTIINSSTYGIYFQQQSYNNTITRNYIQNSGSHGIYSWITTNNNYTFSFNNITGSTGYGVNLDISDLDFYNNSISGSSNLDLYFNSMPITECSNTIANNTGSNGKDILYHNSAFNLANRNNISQIILCNASNSNITNVTSGTSFLFSSTGLNVTGSNISNSYFGFYLYNINSSILNNNTMNNNNQSGLYLAGFNNSILNNNATSNGNYGFDLHKSYYNNTITGNEMRENTVRDLNLAYVTSTSTCNNTIENNTGSGIRKIIYYDSPTALENDWNISQLIVCDASLTNITNVSVTGSSVYRNNGVYLFLSNNVTINNLNSSNNYEGLEIYRSNSSVVLNSILNNNSIYGIYTRGYYQNISGNIINNNILRGMYATSTFNSSITNNIFNSNQYGFNVRTSDYNTITNNTANSNSYYGIFVETGSDNNSYYNNSVSGNTLWDVYSEYNTNNMNRLSVGGVLVNYTYAGTHGIKIHPSSVNLQSGKVNITPHLNITGTNWMDLYIMYEDSDYGDFLESESSLKMWRQDGTNWTELSDSSVDASNNYVTANITNFSIFSPMGTVATESSSSSSSGGGGGAGTTTTQQTSEEVSFTQTFEEITSEKGAVIEVQEEALPVNKISINVKESTEGSVTVSEPSSEETGILPQTPNIFIDKNENKIVPSKSDSTVEFSTMVYKYIKIDTNILDNNIESAEFTVDVEKSWFEENKYDPEKVIVYRYKNGNWEYLNTNLENEDLLYYYYNVKTPGFSMFVITSVPVAESVIDDIDEITVTEDSVEDTSSNMLLIAAIFLIFVAAGYFLFFRKK